VKHSGTHATYGVPNEPQILVQKTSSENPSQKTVARAERQKQLRIDLQSESSGILGQFDDRKIY
jgi:hypothetical protein